MRIGKKRSSSKMHYERELFVIALLVFGASFSNIVSQQDLIHFALTWSLVSTHSLSLNSTLYAGQPYTYQVRGQVFSALPSGLAFFGSVFVAPAVVILPLEPSVAATFLAVYFSCIMGAVATVLFFKTARLLGGLKSSLLLSLIFAFGTGLWLYSRIYLPESLAVTLGIASVYLILRAEFDEKGEVRLQGSIPATGAPSKKWIAAWTLSGMFLGLAIFVDNTSVFLSIPILLYLSFCRGTLLRAKTRLGSLITFISGLLVASIPTVYYNYATTGDAFRAPYGIPLLGGVQMSSYNDNFFVGLYDLLLSPKSGLLLFSPFTVISLFGLVLSLRIIKSQTLFLTGLFLAILIPFSLQNAATYSHNTVGPSELILGIPYLLLLGIGVLDRFKNSRISLLIYALAIASIMINGIIALTDPVMLGIGSQLGAGAGSPFLSTNLPLFVSGSYLTWWSFFRYAWVYAISIILFPVTVFIIYVLSGNSNDETSSKQNTELVSTVVTDHHRTLEPA